MNQKKIDWCIKQKKGIKLIDLKAHLSKSYMDEADGTLENVFSAKGKWKVVTAYYACYNALYSLLMKCGIKSEIHECSIELMTLFGFDKTEINYLHSLKENRIQAQYYLKKIELKDEKLVKRFILKCKLIVNSLTSKQIEDIRNQIKKT